MKTTLQLKLLPSPEQHTILRETMHAFNAACMYSAEIAYEQRLASQCKLQRLVYYEVLNCFGLSSQLAIRAIAKVVEVYKRNKSQRIAFRPDGALVYDERIMSFKGLEAVSLTTSPSPGSAKLRHFSANSCLLVPSHALSLSPGRF